MKRQTTEERRGIASVERRVQSRTPSGKQPWFRDEVIVVDEDVALANMIAYALESTGRLVTVYYDGAEALRELVAFPVDEIRRVLLLSVDLVGIDGHSLHERLQELRPQAFLVAFMSSRGSDADQIRALRAGAVDYLVKPVSIHVLVEKVRVWLALTHG
jgi:two-component system, OmpR family, phosphate regulon response regulator PhoB